VLKYAKEKFNIDVQDACLGVPAAVNPARTFSKIAKLKWDVNVKEILENSLPRSIALINDFEAVGFGVGMLNKDDKKDVIQLKKHAHPTENGVMATIGAGTGLGKNFLIYDKARRQYVPHASEGGHADFPARDSFECALAEFLRQTVVGKGNPVHWESVLSGPGLKNIYKFLRMKKMYKSSKYSKQIDDALSDAKPELIAKCYKVDPACKATIELFTRFYARCAKDMALDLMSRGGVYLAGGIAAKNPQWFTTGLFEKEFENNHNPNLRKILHDIPTYLIVNQDVGLLGAANVAANFQELAIKK
jgi:glucokinase